jgi:ribosome-binding ATPase
MQIGIIGLPQSGKTTIFNALTGSSAATGLSGQKEVNRAVVKVPDPRLTLLSEMFKPKKTTPASVDYMDLCGMGRGSVNAESMDAEFLALLRSVDAILAVARLFRDDNVAHPLDSVDALRDADNLNSEMVLADLIVIEKRLERIDKDAKKTPGKNIEREKELLIQFKAVLEEGKPIRSIALAEKDEMLLRGFRFLSQKPQLIVVNVAEQDLGNEAQILKPFEKYLSVPSTKFIAMSGKIEAEMAELGPEEAKAFRADLGIEEAALNRLIRESYDLLGLMSFFTAGEDECRAWTIRKGTAAQPAAGAIHSDLEKGFIRAEVTPYEDLKNLGSFNAVKAAGRQRLEGKEYVVKDGDILNIRFAL